MNFFWDTFNEVLCGHPKSVVTQSLQNQQQKKFNEPPRYETPVKSDSDIEQG